MLELLPFQKARAPSQVMSKGHIQRSGIVRQVRWERELLSMVDSSRAASAPDAKKLAPTHKSFPQAAVSKVTQHGVVSNQHSEAVLCNVQPPCSRTEVVSLFLLWCALAPESSKLSLRQVRDSPPPNASLQQVEGLWPWVREGRFA